jgi:hypothetical protein
MRQKLDPIPTLKEHNDYFNYVDDCWRCFMELLDVVLIRWRHQLGDPRPALQEAVVVSHRAADIWHKGADPAHIFECNFPFGTAALIGSLLEPGFEGRFLSLLPKIKDWRQFPYFVTKFPDAGLVYAIREGRKPNGWDALMDEGFREQQNKNLYPTTFECYMDLILAAHKGDTAAALEEAKRADELYAMREKDTGYHEFGLVNDGSGGSNWLKVDYRLAALLKTYFRNDKKAVSDLKLIHQWPY